MPEVEAALRSRKLDLLVTDDLGRIIRGAAAVPLLGIGKDNGVRTISINDNIDTSNSGWEQAATAACGEHVGHNANTSLRLKQKMMRRFLKEDAAYQHPIHGYIVPPSAKTFAEWQKDMSATELIQQGALLLFDSQNGAAVAVWFNKNDVPVGLYCRADKETGEKKWTGPMVMRFYKFLQAYAVEKARIEARRQGHMVTEQQLQDGSIKLVVQIGGAA